MCSLMLLGNDALAGEGSVSEMFLSHLYIGISSKGKSLHQEEQILSFDSKPFLPKGLGVWTSKQDVTKLYFNIKMAECLQFVFSSCTPFYMTSKRQSG